jgi:hypothetical protein
LLPIPARIDYDAFETDPEEPPLELVDPPVDPPPPPPVLEPPLFELDDGFAAGLSLAAAGASLLAAGLSAALPSVLASEPATLSAPSLLVAVSGLGEA